MNVKLPQAEKPRDNKKPRRNEDNLEKKSSIEATIRSLTDIKDGISIK